MKERLKKRLQELEQEYQKGQEQLQKLETEANQTRDAMLRISGAIQVLREEVELIETENGHEQKDAVLSNNLKEV